VLTVADTSPLNYLVLIGHIEIVPPLFGRVCIPSAVRDELSDAMTPAVVRTWIAAPPDWLSIMPGSTAIDPSLAGLDDGEREAIELASAIRADLLLMDDRPGVALARIRGLQVTGTLGALDRAALHGMIDLPAAVAALRTTTFHVRADFLEALLARDRQRCEEP
jgi:predicted nucleic acid-binding protein